MKNNILSVVAITIGMVIVLFALGEIILRIITALLGIWLINQGVQLRGSGSLYTRARNWYFFRRF